MHTCSWKHPPEWSHTELFSVFFPLAQHGGSLLSQSNRSTSYSKRQRRCQDQKKRRWRCSGLAHVCFSSFRLSSWFLSFFSLELKVIFFFFLAHHLIMVFTEIHFAISSPRFGIQNTLPCEGWRPEKLWLLPGGASLSSASSAQASAAWLKACGKRKQTNSIF